MERWLKTGLFCVLAGSLCTTASARRRQVELMPRDELSFDGDRTPTESYSHSRAYDDTSRRKNRLSRLMLGAGVTTLAQRPSGLENVKHTIYGAAGAESHQGYLGGDLDLFYGSASVEGQSGGVLQQRTGTLQQFGGFFDMTFDLPLDLAGVLIVPRAGVGYGIQYLSLQRGVGVASSNFGIDIGTNETLHGAFGMGGIILSPVSFLFFSADYSMSFYTNGSISANAGGFDIPLGNGAASFNRLRASAFVRISRTLSLGGQFVERNINFNIPVSVDPNGILSPKQRHFLGVLGIEL